MRLVIMHDRCALFHGDSAELGTVLPPESVDSIVTDPPAGIEFMGEEWDSDKGGREHWIAWLAELLRPAFAALKPGGHALVWAIPRTSHWTATALELVGFEIRDVHHHIFGTGFPKSLNISKAIDAKLGATDSRQKIGEGSGRTGQAVDSHQDVHGDDAYEWPGKFDVTTAGSPEAAKWEGFGTALKPAVEHWILARKPLEGTYAENVLAHGVGALNIGACRVEYDESGPPAPVHSGAKGEAAGHVYGASPKYTSKVSEDGRWPAHLSLEHAETCAPAACVLGCPVRILDEQSGVVGCGNSSPPPERTRTTATKDFAMKPGKRRAGKETGASRFFYVAKAPRKEKDAGLGHLEAKTGGEATGRTEGSAGTKNPRAGAGRTGGARNFHPTVKSVDLMRWLVRLVTPPGGIVLDVFAGSGTTGVAALAEGLSFVGVEQGGKDGRYIPIVEGRLRAALSEYVDGAARPAENTASSGAATS